jgi:RHS repeat-associated protein
VNSPAEGAFAYSYDALGNRTGVTHNGVAKRFLHDPIGLVDVAAEYDAGGTLVARYDHALGLVSRRDGAGSTAFYNFDALGNTRQLTGNGGAVLNAYDYDAFGAATVANETVENAFRFVGRFGILQDDADRYSMRARAYSVRFGVFLSADPIGINGGINLYQYTHGNPETLIDPQGTIVPVLIGVAGIVTVGYFVANAGYEYLELGRINREAQLATAMGDTAEAQGLMQQAATHQARGWMFGVAAGAAYDVFNYPTAFPVRSSVPLRAWLRAEI